MAVVDRVCWVLGSLIILAAVGYQGSTVLRLISPFIGSHAAPVAKTDTSPNLYTTVNLYEIASKYFRNDQDTMVSAADLFVAAMEPVLRRAQYGENGAGSIFDQLGSTETSEVHSGLIDLASYLNKEKSSLSGESDEPWVFYLGCVMSNNLVGDHANAKLAATAAYGVAPMQLECIVLYTQLLYNEGESDAALKISEEYLSQVSDPDSRILMLMQIANLSKRNPDGSSIDYLIEAIELLRDRGVKHNRDLSHAMSVLADVMDSHGVDAVLLSGNQMSSEELLLKAVQLRERFPEELSGSSTGYLFVQLSRSTRLSSEPNLGKSTIYVGRAFQQFESNGDQKGMATARAESGRVAKAQRKYRVAEQELIAAAGVLHLVSLFDFAELKAEAAECAELYGNHDAASMHALDAARAFRELELEELSDEMIERYIDRPVGDDA